MWENIRLVWLQESVLETEDSFTPVKKKYIRNYKNLPEKL